MSEEARIQPPAELGRITFAGADVRPPAPRIIGRGDRLFIRSKCSIPSATVVVRGRLLCSPSDLAPFEYRHVPNSDRSVRLTVHELTAGYLMGLQVYEEDGGARRGQCFVEVGLLRGVEAIGNIVEPLIADYATVDGALGWPGGRILSSLDGPGMLRSVAGTDPAANTEITETVPTNARWRLIGATLQLVTDANPANRRVHLLVDDGANVLFRSVSASNQVASTSENYNVGPHGISSASVAGEHFIPIPLDLMLYQAWRIRTATDSMQAGDDYGAPRLLVEEWIEE